MVEFIEKIIERALWQSRYIVIFAVVASVIAAFLLVLMGIYDVVLILKGLVGALFADGGKEHYEAFHRDAITHTIRAIDAFLIMTVLFIFGVGLYELFISKIDYIDSDTRTSKILKIYTLDELKAKVVKVIIMILIVTFLKHALKFDYTTMLDLLFLSIAILLIALALYFMQKKPVTYKKGVKE